MPKENTHLMFASKLREEVREKEIQGALASHSGSYLLGSIIPDTFFYSSSKSVESISEIFHGKNGRPTNTIILSVLDQARGLDDIAFILGYISHCALDITFHPMVDSMSGDYYDPDPLKKEQAMYLHRSYETCIDAKMQNSMRISSLIRSSMLQGLVFEEIVSRDFNIATSVIERTLSKQILFNRMFTSRPVYFIVRFLHSLGLVKSKSLLGLFYGDIEDSPACIQDPIRYHDPRTGTEIVESLTALFGRARTKAQPMMEAAWGYSRGSVSREQLLTFIPGENLSTGALPTRTGAF